MKNMTKKLAAFGISTGLFFSSLGGASAATVHYKDVNKSDNFHKSVEFLLDKNAISRTLPNFNPYKDITRGQMASILVKVLGLDASNVENPGFRDVPTTHQFYSYIAALENAGLISGYSDGRYGVNDPLTRGQMSGILTKAYRMTTVGASDVADLINSDIMNYSINEYFESSYSFNGQWADEMATLYYYGLISGQKVDNTTKFNPNKPINRSQFANMLYQIEEDYVDQFIVIDVETNKKYEEELGNSLSKIISSNSNGCIEFFDQISHGISGVYNDPHAGTIGNKTTHLVFKVYKEGEVVFEEYELKVIVYKDTNGEWKLDVEKIEEEGLTTTGDTITIKAPDTSTSE